MESRVGLKKGGRNIYKRLYEKYNRDETSDMKGNLQAINVIHSGVKDCQSNTVSNNVAEF